MGKIRCIHTYQDIISLENLLQAWEEFLRGKKQRIDVQQFGLNLMTNIITLHEELKDKMYHHGGYHAFNIADPKPRNIHKASVRDRLLHHALYRMLYPFFDRKFIADSYSCRVGKGTHKALGRFKDFSYRVSKNHTRTAWVLKCDIRKFFANINHAILVGILEEAIEDNDIRLILQRVVESFSSHTQGVGLPLGNLTSQLFVNIYMNEFDQFVKHRLRVKYYIRYADDFVILSEDKSWLLELLPRIAEFLEERLKLELHPKKVSIHTLASGVDFLGWVHFPDHRVLRTVTKRRLLKNIEGNPKDETVASYAGLLSHGNTHKLTEKIRELR